MGLRIGWPYIGIFEETYSFSMLVRNHKELISAMFGICNICLAYEKHPLKQLFFEICVDFLSPYYYDVKGIRRKE